MTDLEAIDHFHKKIKSKIDLNDDEMKIFKRLIVKQSVKYYGGKAGLSKEMKHDAKTINAIRDQDQLADLYAQVLGKYQTGVPMKPPTSAPSIESGEKVLNGVDFPTTKNRIRNYILGAEATEAHKKEIDRHIGQLRAIAISKEHSKEDSQMAYDLLRESYLLSNSPHAKTKILTFDESKSGHVHMNDIIRQTRETHTEHFDAMNNGNEMQTRLLKLMDEQYGKNKDKKPEIITMFHPQTPDTKSQQTVTHVEPVKSAVAPAVVLSESKQAVMVKTEPAETGGIVSGVIQAVRDVPLIRAVEHAAQGVAHIVDTQVGLINNPQTEKPKTILKATTHNDPLIPKTNNDVELENEMYRLEHERQSILARQARVPLTPPVTSFVSTNPIASLKNQEEAKERQLDETRTVIVSNIDLVTSNDAQSKIQAEHDEEERKMDFPVNDANKDYWDEMAQKHGNEDANNKQNKEARDARFRDEQMEYNKKEDERLVRVRYGHAVQIMDRAIRYNQPELLKRKLDELNRHPSSRVIANELIHYQNALHKLTNKEYVPPEPERTHDLMPADWNKPKEGQTTVPMDRLEKGASAAINAGANQNKQDKELGDRRQVGLGPTESLAKADIILVKPEIRAKSTNAFANFAYVNSNQNSNLGERSSLKRILNEEDAKRYSNTFANVVRVPLTRTQVLARNHEQISKYNAIPFNPIANYESEFQPTTSELSMVRAKDYDRHVNMTQLQFDNIKLSDKVGSPWNSEYGMKNTNQNMRQAKVNESIFTNGTTNETRHNTLIYPSTNIDRQGRIFYA